MSVRVFIVFFSALIISLHGSLPSQISKYPGSIQVTISGPAHSNRPNFGWNSNPGYHNYFQQ